MCIFPVAIIFTIFPCWYRRHTVDLLFHGVKLTLFPYIYLSSCPACSRFGAYSPKQTHKKDWTKHISLVPTANPLPDYGLTVSS